mmetsp:Transcript_30085/g.87635  ORF Transcript_30085/g.87635 Transcript_30085/m.87635 type:complete len:363 (-) Transcript_30085:67-1155(-)
MAAAGEKSSPCEFAEARHVGYVKGLAEASHSFEFVATQHLRMSGVYWGLTAMALMNRDLESEMGLSGVVDWVLSCQHPNGGFGGNTKHDPHLLYTLSAVQILAIAGCLHRIEPGPIVRYVASLQQDDGSFVGDQWGEVDTRFSYCALATLALLGHLNEGAVDVPKACEFVASCRNFDGGFGCIPGAESHAAQIFCCVGALAIGSCLHLLDPELLCWWLAERQCDSGGLNGRPEKQADVCYSWWILSSLTMLGRTHWIDKAQLAKFILSCQDLDDGGIADRPGNVADVGMSPSCLSFLCTGATMQWSVFHSHHKLTAIACALGISHLLWNRRLVPCRLVFVVSAPLFFCAIPVSADAAAPVPA